MVVPMMSDFQNGVRINGGWLLHEAEDEALPTTFGETQIQIDERRDVPGEESNQTCRYQGDIDGLLRVRAAEGKEQEVINVTRPKIAPEYEICANKSGHHNSG